MTLFNKTLFCLGLNGAVTQLPKRFFIAADSVIMVDLHLVYSIFSSWFTAVHQRNAQILDHNHQLLMMS